MAPQLGIAIANHLSPHDSGWRSSAGDESDGYVNQPSNVGLYDVNTIANYDQAILPILEAPFGSAFERVTSGQLEPTNSATSGD